MKPGQDPRIVHVGCFDWRYRDGQLECHVFGQGWIRDPMTPEDHAAIAALKQHPTVVREVSAA